MFSPLYSCNQCGVQKQESNNWLVVRITKDCGQIYKRLEVRAFDDGTANDEHICGVTCLSKRISSFTEELRNTVHEIKEDSNA